MKFTTELEGVRSYSVGNMIDELRDRIGSLKLGPFKPSQAGEESIPRNRFAADRQ